MKNLLWMAAVLFLGSWAAAETKHPVQTPADKLGWQLGVHSYTFLKFPIFDAIDKTASLGVKYMSISGGVSLDGKTRIKTVDLSPPDLDALRKKIADAGLTLLNMGVVQLPADEAESRKVFEFAKKLGIDTLVSEPEPDALDTVEKLCKEYNIKVAIHNHPKPSRYWNRYSILSILCACSARFSTGWRNPGPPWGSILKRRSSTCVPPPSITPMAATCGGRARAFIRRNK